MVKNQGQIDKQRLKAKLYKKLEQETKKKNDENQKHIKNYKVSVYILFICMRFNKDKKSSTSLEEQSVLYYGNGYLFFLDCGEFIFGNVLGLTNPKNVI